MSRGLTRSTVIKISILVVCVLAFFLYQMFTPRARSRPRPRCQRNLKTILIVSAQYAGDHDGYFPDGDKAKQLLKPYLKRSPRVWTAGHKRKFPDGCAYEFNTRRIRFSYGISEKARMPYIWDKKGNHKGGRNVGFNDGLVRWMSESKFQEMLSRMRTGEKITDPSIDSPP